MPFKIELATEADYLTMMQIEVACFEPLPIDRMFFPDGRNEKTLELQKIDLAGEVQRDPTLRIIKVVDTEDNNRAVAFAKWKLLFGDYLSGAAKVEDDRPQRAATIPDLNPAAMKFWYENIVIKRTEYLEGKPHCYLSTMVTAPKYQGRGAGTLLLRWGCDIADQNGVPMFLQSTEAGYRVYQKCGFGELYKTDLDLAPLGIDGVYKTWFMCRQPQSA